MKALRLFEILYLLQGRERVTARELSERLGISVRNVYRDIEDLSAQGMPVYMTRGRNGGISLLPGFSLRDTWLTQTEKDTLLSALEAMRVMDDPSSADLFNKLSAFFGQLSVPLYDIDFQDWDGVMAVQFEKAREALLRRRILCFDYLSAMNQASHRSVEPDRLCFKHRTWYLKGYCLDQCAVRTFRLSRMRHVQVTEDTFVPRQFQRDEGNRVHFDTAMVEVTIRVGPSAQYRVLDEFPASAITPAPDIFT